MGRQEGLGNERPEDRNGTSDEAMQTVHEKEERVGTKTVGKEIGER